MEPYSATVLAIDRMENMPNGGHVEKSARQAAASFIWTLRNRRLPVPDVGPSPDGGVAMAWTFKTPEGELEIDAIFLDWARVEYREGFSERDGFLREAIIDEAALIERLFHAIDSTQHVA